MMKKDEESRPKPTYENALAQAPDGCRGEIMRMDECIKSLRPLKFKRIIDKSGAKIKYVAADFGISYAINVAGGDAFHHFGWYFVYDRDAKRWYRKADCMDEMLAVLEACDPQLAGRIFDGFKQCTLCKSPTCGQITYRHRERERVTCYGRVYMGMNAEGFRDARAFFTQLNGLLVKKASCEDA